MRTLVIGDIHGAYKALIQVIERCNLQDGDTIIFLGDYVDGWSQSFEVITFLLELSKSYKCIFIKGNHDVWCESWLTTNINERIWLVNGGYSTIESYLKDTKQFERVAQKHLIFFNHLLDYHIDSKNNLFIHAGFSSMHGPKSETFPTNYYWDRTLWEMALALDPTIEITSKRYPKRLKHFNEIFIGHTSTTNYGTTEPIHAGNLWNLDTGSGFSGKLTIMDIDTKEFWQSDNVPTLYPNEKGRN